MTKAFSRIMSAYDAKARLDENISLEEYIELVEKNPKLAQTAYERVYDMIMTAGTENIDGDIHYNFFDNYLVGVDAQIRAIMEYVKGAARGLDVRKRILLLIGPPGAGKSTSLIALKAGIHNYSQTDAGRLYAIADCPMAEDPLHLVPHELRHEISKSLGVVIDGELCPVCQLKLRESGIDGFRIVRYTLDEQLRHGVGTFVPGTEKDMSMDHLVGSLDYSRIAEFGSESDPRAYRFNGELNVANRGIMEFQEILKATAPMLYVLLGVASEHAIKTPRFALISADEFVIGHANLNEYSQFVVNKENEAIANRMYVVKMPYVLKTSDEQKIYDRMLHDITWTDHVAPHVLYALALFTVMSRLTTPKSEDISLLTKAKLYDGDTIGEFTDHQIYDLKRENQDEGMSGLSPRDAMNVFTHASSRTEHACTTHVDILRALRERITQNGFLSMTSAASTKMLDGIFGAVRAEIDKLIREDVQTAFVHAFDDSAQTLFQNYLEHARAFTQRDKVLDEITGETQEPDKKLLRQIEEAVGVSENAATSFRQDILIRQGIALSAGNAFRWDSHPRLKEGISKKLFADAKGIMITNLTTRTPDEKQQEQRAQVIDRMKHRGYCDICAEAALTYTGRLMQQG